MMYSTEWEHWNACIWLDNDETLSSLVDAYLAQYTTPMRAALALHRMLHLESRDITPDGTRITAIAIEHTMEERV